jgi:hypothetical protein
VQVPDKPDTCYDGGHGQPSYNLLPEFQAQETSPFCAFVLGFVWL